MSYWLMKPLSVSGDAKHLDSDDIIFPGYASRKLDGIRACIECGIVKSNSRKPIASLYVQGLLSQLENFDGELVYGDPTHPECYNKTQSAVNSIHWPAELDKKELRFHVFDYRCLQTPTRARLDFLKAMVKSHAMPEVVYVEQTLVYTFDDLTALYNQYLAEGYEGLMFKRTGARYKAGRSGKTDQPLLRMKPFGTEFFEAQIVGYECAYRNENELFYDEQGFAKRSSHQENKVPLDMLGAYIVRDCVSNIEFRLPASAIDHVGRVALWQTRDSDVGKYVRYTCLAYGAKVKPRMPSFRGFRSTTDFSPTGEF